MDLFGFQNNYHIDDISFGIARWEWNSNFQLSSSLHCIAPPFLCDCCSPRTRCCRAFQIWKKIKASELTLTFVKVLTSVKGMHWYSFSNDESLYQYFNFSPCWIRIKIKILIFKIRVIKVTFSHIELKITHLMTRMPCEIFFALSRRGCWPKCLLTEPLLGSQSGG